MVYSGPIKTGDGPFTITQAYKDNAQQSRIKEWSWQVSAWRT